MLYGIITLVVSFFGFAALAFSLERHYAQISEGELTSQNKLIFRVIGWVLLAVSVVPCVFYWGTSIGLSVWFLAVGVSGSILVMILSYVEKRR